MMELRLSISDSVLSSDGLGKINSFIYRDSMSINRETFSSKIPSPFYIPGQEFGHLSRQRGHSYGPWNPPTSLVLL